MIAPRVHLNGTSKNALLDAIHTASIAINSAADKLRDTAPHARDYYVISTDAYPQARDEYIARLNHLHAANDELIAMYRAIEENEIEFSTGV